MLWGKFLKKIKKKYNKCKNKNKVKNIPDSLNNKSTSTSVTPFWFEFGWIVPPKAAGNGFALAFTIKLANDFWKKKENDYQEKAQSQVTPSKIAENNTTKKWSKIN